MIKDIETPEEVEDFVSDNWKREIVKSDLIRMGKGFDARPLKDQLEYFWKLASSLNRAVKDKQTALNAANKLLISKESQLIALKNTVLTERGMIQKQLATANTKRQELLAENQRLYTEIKELEDDNKHRPSNTGSVNSKG